MSATADDKVIMGIDPGTNIMGYAFIGVNGNRARLITMGVIDMRKCKDVYMKLGEIFARVQGLITSFLPDELAIEAPFFGKNVQSVLKLGRAQGVAIAAAISRQARHPKSRSRICCAACSIFQMRRCRSLWMPLTPSVRRSVIFCRTVSR